MSTYNASEESATPPAPASGRKLLYPKALGWFSKDSAGNEKQISPLIGEIKIYAGAITPDGWALCNGAPISRTYYSALFAVIGTTYGAGDGSTTFNLPDLRNRFPLGNDGGMLGSAGGNAAVTLTTSNMPSHSHTATLTPGETTVTAKNINPDGGAYESFDLTSGRMLGSVALGRDLAAGWYDPSYTPPAGYAVTNVTIGGVSHTGGSVSVSSVGGGAAVDILPPLLTLNFIIAVL